MSMQLSSVFARALLRGSAWAPAPAAAAAVALVVSRRLFSNTTRGGGRGAHLDKRIEKTKEELLDLYKGKTPAPAAEEVAADLTGVLRRFEAAKTTPPGQEQHRPTTFVGDSFVGDSFAGDSFVGDEFVGEPFAGEHFDTEPYEADGSVDGYSFSGGTYEGDSHSGDIYTPWPGSDRETRRGGG